MAKNETRRLRPATLQTDKDAYTALTGVENYAPANPTYTVTALEAAYKDMEAKQAKESKAFAAYQTERDNANEAEWVFHNLVLGTKDQVKAQFGKDSNEVQALGIKKKSEYQSPSRKKPAKTS